MAINDSQSKIMTDVVINIGYGGFELTDEMCDALRMDDRFPSQKELPRHDHRLVSLVRTGHGAPTSERDSGLIVKTIEGNRYKINEYDGHETIMTPDTVDWVVVPPMRSFQPLQAWSTRREEVR